MPPPLVHERDRERNAAVGYDYPPVEIRRSSRRAERERSTSYGRVMMRLHVAGTNTGGFSPSARQAAGFRSIPAPFLIFFRLGIVSARAHTTLRPFASTRICVPRTGLGNRSQSSGGRAHIGTPFVVSSPHFPTPLSPTLKHSCSLPPRARHRRNAVTSAGSAKLDASPLVVTAR